VIIMMQVIPAIDLMDGKVVRLTRGDPSTGKNYDYLGTPVEIARKWKNQGAERLHVIDLDAAFGKGNNLAVIAEIVAAAGIPVQVGGGIRSYDAADKLLSAGISYVILGALAFSDPKEITRIMKKFGSEHVIVALDNKDGQIMVEGWQTATNLSVSQAMEKFQEHDIHTFFITSIAMDGTLQGPDLETLRDAVQTPGVNVIAAGGIGGLNDLVALKRLGLKAIVVGKALYEGRFSLAEAIKTVNGV
jgi:phosphoribosylformimino-5-aminoimidazole carboxamide ribotide isomerase